MKNILMKKQAKIIIVFMAFFLSMSCKFFTQPGSDSATSTSIPADTSTPPPSASATALNSSSPYILFSGTAGIWITNPDGSFPTKISDLDIGAQDLHRALSPSGDRLALVVSNDQGIDLVEVKIPGGESKVITHLLDITKDELINKPLGQKAFASYAISGFYNNVAWQPGSGQLLAFVGAVTDTTSDLYVYDSQTEKVTQLTNGPSQAINPNWSPDGKYILHFGVSWQPPFGGAIGAANQLDGVWAVQVSDGKVITLPKPKSVIDNFVGWQDDTHYLTYDSNDECFAQNLHSVDVVSGEEISLIDLSFYYQIAQSPENKSLIFAGADGCTTSPGEGIFLLPAGQTTPTRLADKRAYDLTWLVESRVFQAYPEALFSSDGSARYDPPVYNSSFKPAVSIHGYQAWEVIENQQGRTMLKVPGGDWQTIQNGLVDQLIWDPITGETLLIVLEDGSLYAATSPNFSPQLIGNLGAGTSQAIWVP